MSHTQITFCIVWLLATVMFHYSLSELCSFTLSVRCEFKPSRSNQDYHQANVEDQGVSPYAYYYTTTEYTIIKVSILLPYTTPSTPPMIHMVVNILTINSEGLNHPAKQKSLWKEALQQNCDILCVQETHFQSQSPPKCTHPKFPFMYQANADKKKKGVIMIRDTIAFRLHQINIDPQGGFIIMVCDINSYTVANIYVPNVRQTRFLHRIMRKIRLIQKRALVMCRDFNNPPDPNLDSTSKPKRKPPSLKPLLSAYELHDAWRCLNANERDYSFFLSSHKSYSRIDFFWWIEGYCSNVNLPKSIISLGRTTPR